MDRSNITNSSRNTSVPSSLIIPRTIVYVVIGLFILLGNALCLTVFLRTKSLRRRSYDLLISLSVADILVGFSSILICVEDGLALRGQRNEALSTWRDMVQYFPRMCSLFTVTSVAIERFWAVGYPAKHRTAGKVPYMALITIPWGLSGILATLYLSGTMQVISLNVFNFIDVVLSQMTLLTIVIAYCALMAKMKAKNSTSRHQRSVLKERKLAVTLFVVTLASLITIYPVNIYFIVQVVHDDHRLEISENLFLFLIALACCNSGVNVVVYMFRIKEFQRAVCKMVGRHRHSRVSCYSSRNEDYHSHNNSSLAREHNFK